jgi:DNA-binding IscR family transcriptional regulator
LKKADNFDLKKFITEGKLLKEEDTRYSSEEGSGRTWKLLNNDEDIKVGDIISILYGPGVTRDNKYKVVSKDSNQIGLSSTKGEVYQEPMGRFLERIIHVLDDKKAKDWKQKQTQKIQNLIQKFENKPNLTQKLEKELDFYK